MFLQYQKILNNNNNVEIIKQQNLKFEKLKYYKIYILYFMAIYICCTHALQPT